VSPRKLPDQPRPVNSQASALNVARSTTARSVGFRHGNRLPSQVYAISPDAAFRFEHSGCEQLAAFASLPLEYGPLRIPLLGTVLAIALPQTCTGNCVSLFFHDLEVSHDKSRFRFEVAAWRSAPSGDARSEADSSPTGARSTRKPLLARRIRPNQRVGT